MEANSDLAESYHGQRRASVAPDVPEHQSAAGSEMQDIFLPPVYSVIMCGYFQNLTKSEIACGVIAREGIPF